MKYLLAVLILAVSNGLSKEVEKKPFKSITLTELKELCTKQNNSYDSLTEAKNLANQLESLSCNDTNKEKLIENLVNEILPCFDNETKPSDKELKIIYQDISNKLCHYKKLYEFRIDLEKCNENKNNPDCKPELNNLMNRIILDKDMLFFTLSMSHFENECSPYRNISACTAENIIKKCESDATTLINLAKEFLDTMNCV
ncbi:uncharacterized protein LOC127276578 [Leptopilina boulardi]|uniref:uncharacterized protein LOC127276578 n=1 Tax=Leptopilina boulardi TaxID=63433 RepID=UPI0021F540F8|nr:uncharacterized protein LOC127276578 [Leptopilina boulardi]